ncbi:hypothetical protein ACFFGF_04865 [Asaia lannensis]|uniref:Uncharacterized protein n=1 Tax=Asaia lannensis NBRC 102526 TaxID=1307926 RepID=A0ABT1CIG2_9PROT|nr:hypothetical protein [Asaia lannensis]MCO6160654.1 hypothetical protein [Asaia lannensis NBRC 102526]GBR02077.1 hypothetical protein AA102526_2710 [Asaia lannensis NBRC 102526]
MSDTKKCAYCKATFFRPPGVRLSKWIPRRFCSVACGVHSGGSVISKRTSQKRAADLAKIDPKYANYSLEDVIRDCGGIDAIAAHCGMPRHAIRYWHRVPDKRRYAIRDLSGAPLAVIDRVTRSSASTVPPENKPKITRIDPLPAGSPETWGEMMPGISWADARRNIAQMGTR